MKAAEIQVGKTYLAKVSGKLTTVRVDTISTGTGRHLGYNYAGQSKGYADRMVYGVTNLATDRKTVFKSAAKFRREVLPRAETASSMEPTVDSLHPQGL